MTTWSIRLRLFLITLFLVGLSSWSADAQIRVGGMPSINYNHKFKDFWEINFKVASRAFLFQPSATKKLHWEPVYSLTDITTLGARKIGLNSKIVLGAMARITVEGWAYRSIQQFIFSTKIHTLKMVSRVAADQTFSKQKPPKFRWRYRASTQIPLSGQKVDASEFYLKINLEKLSNLQAGKYDLEVRVVPHIGYVLNPQHKIELGVDTRLDSFLGGTPRFTTWLCINWYVRQLGATKKK